MWSYFRRPEITRAIAHTYVLVEVQIGHHFSGCLADPAADGFNLSPTLLTCRSFMIGLNSWASGVGVSVRPYRYIPTRVTTGDTAPARVSKCTGTVTAPEPVANVHGWWRHALGVYSYHDRPRSQNIICRMIVSEARSWCNMHYCELQYTILITYTYTLYMHYARQLTRNSRVFTK